MSIARVLFVALPLSALAAGASADVVEMPPRPCAPWQDRVAMRHTFACVDRACRSDAQCSGGHCYDTRRVCVVGTREVGACTSEGRCVEGQCLALGTCAQ